jgi:hypothetical protein
MDISCDNSVISFPFFFTRFFFFDLFTFSRSQVFGKEASVMRWERHLINQSTKFPFLASRPLVFRMLTPQPNGGSNRTQVPTLISRLTIITVEGMCICSSIPEFMDTVFRGR